MQQSFQTNGTQTTPKQLYDFVGLGFGPANLALAVTVAEEGHQKLRRTLSTVYLEKQPTFAWHAGMMLDDSRMQVTFLKDLVTMRNPQSRYTFINYLLHKERLHHFINLRTFYPKRWEFNDYYQWVADDFVDQVQYQRQVERVLPVYDADRQVTALDVRARNLCTHQEESYRAANAVVALGGKPFVPGAITTSTRIFHSALCKFRLEQHFQDRQGAYHFVVVGSGQTGADVVYHLINQYPNAKITMVIRGFAFRPQDDSHFVNELLFPEVPGFLYHLEETKRRKLLAEYADVTHSAVDIDLIPLIYDAIYADKATGQNRIQCRRFLELHEATESGHVVRCVCKDLLNDSVVELTCDALIMATGYDFQAMLDILQPVAPHLVTDTQGHFKVGPHYDIQRQPGFRPKIYLQGYCEATHGVSEILLSLLPLRSRQVLDDLVAHLRSSHRVWPVPPWRHEAAISSRDVW